MSNDETKNAKVSAEFKALVQNLLDSTNDMYLRTDPEKTSDLLVLLGERQAYKTVIQRISNHNACIDDGESE
jgi:hypothetical protein